MDYVEYNETNLQSFEVTQTAISNGSLVGTCELGNAEIQLINDSNEYSEFKNKWIRTPFGSLYVHDVEPVQEKVNIKLSCYDIKYIMDVEYVQSEYDSMFPCTIATWRNRIARTLGINFNDGNLFPNANFELPSHPYVDKGSTYRDVIKTIAQACACWVECDNTDKFYFKWLNNNEIEVDDWLELTTEKVATQPVNAVVLGRGDVEDIVVHPKPLPSNPYEFRIDNNYILDPQDTTTSYDRRNDVIQPIYNQVNGLSYIPFTLRTQSVENVFNLNLGTKIKYHDIWDNELTSIVMTRTLKWLGNDVTSGSNWEITVSATNINESSSDYKKATPSDKITNIGISVDKQNGKIESVVQAVGDRTGKSTTITQDLDRIESEISEIADITITKESEYAKVEFKDNDETINVSEPILIVVRPMIQNITYSYPHSNSYPTNDYDGIRILRFTNLDTNESQDYEIPDDLLIYDETYYDEFTLDYENQVCKITKWCDYNNDGTVKKLNQQSVVTYDYPSIELTEGKYRIELLSYTNGYLFVRLMAKNIYTDQFATKVELNSAITQTASEIELSVDKKIEGVDKTIDDNYTTLSSKIDMKADSITSEVSKTYATKTELGTQYTTLDSKIDQTSSSITSTVSQTYATKSSLNSTNSNVSTLQSQIKQTATSIDLSTSDNNTSAGITIKLKNADGTQLDTKTANISMSGLVKFTDLSNAGSTTINGANITTGTLSADRVSGGTLSGSTLNLYSSNAMNVYGSDGKLDVKVANDGIGFYDDYGNYSGRITSINKGTNRGVGLGTFSGNRMNLYKDASNHEIAYFNAGYGVHSPNGFYGPSYPNSLEELKKNIVKYDNNALTLIKDSQIYTYNYKIEEDEYKKHFGFIIGKKYKTPYEVLNNEKDAIDLYSMCSILWKGVQEQQTMIEQQQKQIEELNEKVLFLMKESDK